MSPHDRRVVMLKVSNSLKLFIIFQNVTREQEEDEVRLPGDEDVSAHS